MPGADKTRLRLAERYRVVCRDNAIMIRWWNRGQNRRTARLPISRGVQKRISQDRLTFFFEISCRVVSGVHSLVSLGILEAGMLFREFSNSASFFSLAVDVPQGLHLYTAVFLLRCGRGVCRRCLWIG